MVLIAQSIPGSLSAGLHNRQAGLPRGFGLAVVIGDELQFAIGNRERGGNVNRVQ